MRFADIKIGNRYSYFTEHKLGEPAFSLNVIISGKSAIRKEIDLIIYSSEHPNGLPKKIKASDAHQILDHHDLFSDGLIIKKTKTNANLSIKLNRDLP